MKNQKVLILGSGALKIGEAGEFDYSGSQAIKALKEERIKTVLVNPNIATIQTSKVLTDTVYFLPVNDFFVEKIIEKEKPDGILLSFGGQTALNCGIKLYKRGVLKKHQVRILGTPMSAVLLTEDRNKFARHLEKNGVSIPKSATAKNLKQALLIGEKIGFPVMIRAGFSLGGQGSGIAKNAEELKKIAEHAFSFISQLLIEQSLNHYKEVEYEVVRDKYDNCITVCNMENMDPMGIHTGESIVVAPSQTLTNFEYHFLRQEAIKVARSLKIVGECNVQFALNPRPTLPASKLVGGRAKPTKRGVTEVEGLPTARSELFRRKSLSEHWREGNDWQDPELQNPPIDYYVIEVNARLSRSSALASKATGYPLAYIAAKLALGKNLTEIQNKVTGVTQSCFEPALDYIVVKIPRWDMEKFKGAEEEIGSSMKSVGEVMGIGRTFEEAFQKSIRMLDLDFEGVTDEKMLKNGHSIKSLTKELTRPTPRRIFAIAKALKKGFSIKKIQNLTGIDLWFLYRIQNLVNTEKQLVSTPGVEELLNLKKLGFSDKRIGEILGCKGLDIRKIRKKMGITPFVFQIDTLAAEFPAKTNYLYFTYSGQHHDVEPLRKKGVIVLGSGPYRIGSSVEFDWTSVNTAMTLKSHNKNSIIVNCNPETVSTDYDISQRLYFEELTFERIADIYEFENSYGVIVSVGGQTPNNRAQSLKNYGFNVLGTNPDDIDRAEDRNKFSKLCDQLSISQPEWKSFVEEKDAISFCEKIGYPVLLRPSYVLSGSAMNIAHNREELIYFIERATLVSTEYPVTISKFIEEAKEIELDAVAQKGEVKVSVISEHVENAGVHSGDATIVLPPQKVYIATQRAIENIAQKLAKSLRITGPFNIQFLAKDNEVQVIEINLRASRTFPFISKVTGVDFIKLCVDAFFGRKIKKVLLPQLNFVAAKVAQFSFARLRGADPIIRVEMASTGEVACFGDDLPEAFLKGELSVGGKIPTKGIFVSLGGDENKLRFLETLQGLNILEIPIFATEKTSNFLLKNNVKAKRLYKIHEKKSPNILSCFQKGKVDLAINITDSNIKKDIDDDYVIRRSAVDHNIPLFTDIKKAELFIKAITTKNLDSLPIKSWDEYV